jgi:glyoxylase-like metal-dependent hydrolase (beta-lactamase superfamily II)
MKIHTIQGYIQNIHLVEYDHGCLLLDGCSIADFDLLKSYFETHLKRPFQDLKAVVVTHMHPDHAGCAHALRKATSCQIFSGHFTHQWYAGIQGKFAHLVDIGLATWVASRMGKKRRFIWYSPSLKPDVMLEDNAPIPEFEEWKIISTPGHTDRDISVFHSASGHIYVADLIVQVKKQLAPPFPVHHPDLYKASLSKLKTLDIKYYLMAHVAKLNHNDVNIDKLLDISPAHPKTSWLAFKGKVKRALRL